MTFFLSLHFFVRFDRLFARFLCEATSAHSPSTQNQNERDRRYYGQSTEHQPQMPTVGGSCVLSLLTPE